MYSALFTILAMLFAVVQADQDGSEGLNTLFLPVSISGKCLLVLYTPGQTLKSKEWITQLSTHSWSQDVPVAIFNQKPEPNRHGTFNCYKTCHVIAIFTEGINTLPKNALRLSKPMMKNDFVVITDHVHQS